MPNESEENDYLAIVLFMKLSALIMKLSALINFRLIKPHTLTMKVEPVGERYKNRRPDLVVLEPEQLFLQHFPDYN